MNNATIILFSAALWGLLYSPWWLTMPIGAVLGLICCIVVDLLWWLLRKLAA